MRFLGKMPHAMMVLVSCLLVFGTPVAYAESNTYERMQDRQLSRRTGIDIQIIQQRQNRRDFQAQQDWNREVERLNAEQPPGQLRVPVIRPSCQLPIDGNAYMGRRCR